MQMSGKVRRPPPGPCPPPPDCCLLLQPLLLADTLQELAVVFSDAQEQPVEKVSFILRVRQPSKRGRGAVAGGRRGGRAWHQFGSSADPPHPRSPPAVAGCSSADSVHRRGGLGERPALCAAEAAVCRQSGGAPAPRCSPRGMSHHGQQQHHSLGPGMGAIVPRAAERTHSMRGACMAWSEFPGAHARPPAAATPPTTLAPQTPPRRRRVRAGRADQQPPGRRPAALCGGGPG